MNGLGTTSRSVAAALVVAVLTELVGSLGYAVDAGREVGVAVLRMGAGVGQGADEVGGVVVGLGAGQASDRGASLGGDVGQGGDLAGESAQLGRVAAGPCGDGAVVGSSARRSRVALTRCSAVVPTSPGRRRT